MSFPQLRSELLPVALGETVVVVAEPDTYQPDIAGVNGIRRASAGNWTRALAATVLLWNPSDQDGPLDVQPDTYQQQIQGTQSLAAHRLLRQPGLGWHGSETAVVVEPDTWTPRIEGQQALARQILRSRAAAPFGWTTAQDDTDLPTQPDTYQPPTTGTRSVSTHSLRRQPILGWHGSDGPLVAEPDTWTPPIEGQRSLSRQVLHSRIAAPLGFTTAQDDSAAQAQPDTYQPPIAGVRAIGQASTRFSRASATLSALLWRRSVDEFTLDVQPDTYQPPIAGQRALRKNSRLAFLQWGWWTADVPTTAAPEPDTAIQPIQGQRSLGEATRRFSARARATALGWHSPTTVSSLGTQPDTYQPPISGLKALGTTIRERWTRARVATRSLWRIHVDESGPLATQPDTFQGPIAGTAHLRRQQIAYTRRTRAASIGWQTTLNDPPVLFNPAWARFANQLVDIDTNRDR